MNLARRGVLGLTLLAAGCAPGGAPTVDPIPYTLDARGIQLLDRPQRVDFGRTDHSAIRAMTKLAGGEPEATGGCANGAQFARWRDGSVLVFQSGDFRGWSRGETAAGLVCA